VEKTFIQVISLICDRLNKEPIDVTGKTIEEIELLKSKIDIKKRTEIIVKFKM
jgi:hypothetical protein